MFSVKKNNDNKLGQDIFLDAIRYSGVSEYGYIVFKGFRALTIARILQSANKKGIVEICSFLKVTVFILSYLVAETPQKLKQCSII
jgi:hypothetical protein